MKNTFTKIKFFVAMLTLWFLLNFNFELTTIIFGILVSFFVSLLACEVLYDENRYIYSSIKVHRFFIYILLLFIEIFKASFLFIINLFKRDYVPTVFKIVLNFDDPVKVAIVANSITLTPGTITIDIQDNTIIVMVLAKPNTPHEELEKPIREKFEKLLLNKEKKL